MGRRGDTPGSRCEDAAEAEVSGAVDAPAITHTLALLNNSAGRGGQGRGSEGSGDGVHPSGGSQGK